MSMITIESTTWFDRLPTEIIFEIFDYLSNNDIIYTFFYFNQRLNNLLVQNQCYLTYLELPTTNFDIWKNILSIISSRIECLNINTIDSSLSLSYFPNIKSIIISLPFNLLDEQLKLILDSKQFPNLNSFKIKENKLFSNRLYYDRLTCQNTILNKIFNRKNSLETFEYSLTTALSFTELDYTYWTTPQTNFNLHSLTLILTEFEEIFDFIQYTPNLKYLNVKTKLLTTYETRINKINIKLEQLYLTLNKFRIDINLDQLINVIKQFSSSLICLSLNLVGVSIRNQDDFPFNSIKLKQLLESMKELKQFHLYAKLIKSSIYKNILSNFQNQYWFDHNWSFGMHGNYFYTLPFHFDHLYEFYEGFHTVQSNNPEILINNPQIWYYVKSIDLLVTSNYDTNFVKELKIKMPKLTSIKFADIQFPSTCKTVDFHIINDEREKMNLRLNNVTTIEFIRVSIEQEKEWLIHSLPNLRHLSLSHRELPSINSKLAPILNERIQRLDIYGDSQLKQLTQISYVYFSNVQYINFCLNDSGKKAELYADVVMKMLTNFQNLKILLIYIHWMIIKDRFKFFKIEFNKLIQCLNMNEIMKKYQVKRFHEYYLFSKQECEHICLQNNAPITSEKSSFFSSINRLFF